MMNKLFVLSVLCATLFYGAVAGELKCSGANEEYTCGIKCPKTCTSLDVAVKCFSGCDEGCFCKEGYVRSEETEQCVKPTECPTCGYNEIFKPRGFDCRTCPNRQWNLKCPLIEKYRCYCYPEQVRRDDTGTCVNPEDCSEALRYRRTGLNGN